MASNTPNPDADSSEESAGVGSEADAAAELSPMDRQADIRDLDTSLSAMTDLLLSATDTDCDLEGDFAVAGVGSAAEAPRPGVVPVVANVGAGVGPSAEGTLGAAHDVGPGGAAVEEDAVDRVEQVQAALAEALSEVEADSGLSGGVNSTGALPVDAGPEGQTPSEAGSASAAGDAIPTSEIDALMAAVSAELEELDAQADAAGGVLDAVSETEPPGAGSGLETGSPAGGEQEGGGRGAGEPSPPEADIGETAGVGPMEEPAPAPKQATAGEAPDAATRGLSARGGGVGSPAVPAASAPSPGSGAGGSARVAPAAAPASRAVSGGLKSRVVAVASPLAARGSAVLADILVRGLEPLAEVLAGQSKLMRHSLAWLALWTAFNAGCVWGFLVLFRSTGGQVGSSQVTQIAGSDALPGAPAGPGAAPGAGPAGE